MLKGNLETKTSEVLEKCEKLMFDMIKESGSGIENVMDIDTETGRMIGASMELYKGAKELSIAQAKAFDDMNFKIGVLEKQNENLYHKIDDLCTLLMDR